MADAPYSEEISQRLARELEAQLWPEGPTFIKLVDRFAQVSCEEAHLDSWIPMASPLTHPIVAYYFQGAALRLADRLLVHPKVASVALMFACINHVFFGRSPDDIGKLILGLDKPTFDGRKSEAVHRLGADASDEWLALGLDAKPPTWQLQKFMKLCEKYAVEDAKNPAGLANLASSLMGGVVKKKPRGS